MLSMCWCTRKSWKNISNAMHPKFFRLLAPCLCKSLSVCSLMHSTRQRCISYYVFNLLFPTLAAQTNKAFTKRETKNVWVLMKTKPLNDRYEKHSLNLNKKVLFHGDWIPFNGIKHEAENWNGQPHWMVSLVVDAVDDDGVHGRCANRSTFNDTMPFVKFKNSESRRNTGLGVVSSFHYSSEYALSNKSKIVSYKRKRHLAFILNEYLISIRCKLYLCSSQNIKVHLISPINVCILSRTN